MKSSETLRRKVNNASDLLSIVRTMKAHAVASIRQYEDAAHAIAEFNRTIDLSFQYLMRSKPKEAWTREATKDGVTGAILLGSDQGMCGGFNERLVSFALNELEEDVNPQRAPKFFAVGARLIPHIEAQGAELQEIYRVPNSLAGITALIQKLITQVDPWRTELAVGRVCMIYQRRSASGIVTPRCVWLFPVDRRFLSRFEKLNWNHRSLPYHRASWDSLYYNTVRQHVFVTMYRALADSLQSENASRLAAMQRAEKNIEELLEELVWQRNHLRQASITSELLDIVSGYEAVKCE